MHPNDSLPAGTDPLPVPFDPIGEAVARIVSQLATAAAVDVSYSREGEAPAVPAEAVATATGAGPPGWAMSVSVRLHDRVAGFLRSDTHWSLSELLGVLPDAALATCDLFRGSASPGSGQLAPSIRRAMRDVLAVEVLVRHLQARTEGPPTSALVADTVDYLIDLSASRVENRAVTHGVVLANVDAKAEEGAPRYPHDIRAAKRAPLLFDGIEATLVVDLDGFARTEVARGHLPPRAGAVSSDDADDDEWLGSGALVAQASKALGGLGFYLRPDRSIWTFVDGQPLLVRRAGYWSAFPLALGSAIASIIGGGRAASLVARAVVAMSVEHRGAILAIVDDVSSLDGVVPLKDRFDLRGGSDARGTYPEARLHQLLVADDLDLQTLVRLASLDGATVVDRHGRLVAYAAVVASSESEHEGARTAAARTLSKSAEVAVRVSVDGDVTIFRSGTAITTLMVSSRPDERR